MKQKLSLAAVDVQQLSLRYQAQYYTCLSDVYKCRGVVDIAREHCERGLQIARDGHFADQIKAAECRLRSLSLTE